MPRVDLGARSRLTTLDGFDARVRPAAIIYDPLRKVDAASVLPQVRLGVKPQQRTDPQPIRVIHNGRFSLPAGTYDIAVTFSDQVPSQPTPFSLQVGRVGPPLQTWTLQPQAGETWHTSMWLALDASFVGFRGPAEMERAITVDHHHAHRVVDAGARPRLGEVLSAASYPDVMFYFHNEQMYPEPNGFWTIGRRSAEVTVAVAARPHGAGGAAHSRRRAGQQRHHHHVRLAARSSRWCPARRRRWSCRWWPAASSR